MMEWWKFPLSQLCAASLQNSDRIQFTIPPHTHKHKKYSYAFHIVSLSVRADKEFLQIHDFYVKFGLSSRNDWPSNFLENYPQGFYRGSFLNFSFGTSSSPVTLPCHVCARGQITPKMPKSAKFTSLFIHSKVLYIC